MVFFEVIKNNAERLIRLVNNVIDFERIELGKFGMRFGQVKLSEIAREVIVGFKPQALQKAVDIELEASESFTVWADEDRMKQVLINLISNALNFSPESSSIDVTVRDATEGVFVSVSDKGAGISPEDMEKLFKEFYSKGMKKGTGLGLVICKGIVEAHSGEIGVMSKPGQGSCFYFSIPNRKGDVQD